MITQKQWAHAGHTLWQAAVASGGVGEIAKSVTDHSVNLPGVEQGLMVAGVAVAGAGLSVAKSLASNYMVSHKADKSVRAAVELEATAKAVADYMSKHAATPAVVPAA